MSELIKNIDLVHTTSLGEERIKKNLGLKGEIVEYLKEKILSKNCKIYKEGKNYYAEVDGIRVTINSYSYTIITAHKMK